MMFTPNTSPSTSFTVNEIPSSVTEPLGAINRMRKVIYQEISELHLQQNNLRAAIHSSSVVANCHDEQHLASSVYQEITKQLTKQLPHQALSGFALALCHRQLRVLHSQGTLAELQDCRQLEDFPQLIQAMLRQAMR